MTTPSDKQAKASIHTNPQHHSITTLLLGVKKLPKPHGMMHSKDTTITVPIIFNAVFIALNSYRSIMIKS